MSLLPGRSAASRLGVGYTTMKRWIHSGKVRTSQTEGGHYRVSEVEIDRLLAHRPAFAKATAGQAARRRQTNDDAIGGLSARNRIHGFIDEVRIDGLLAQVRLRVGDQTLTAVITADAVRALKLRRGADAFAIIKSTEVMIGVPTK